MSIRREDLWKFVGFILFVGTATAGHTDSLPQLLQPYKNWFEILGWAGALWNAYKMVPPSKPQ